MFGSRRDNYNNNQAAVEAAIQKDDVIKLMKIENLNGNEFVYSADGQRQRNYLYNRDENFDIPLRSLGLLHLAAYYNALHCFAYLVQSKIAEDMLKTIHNNLTPLHYACYKGSFEVAAYIISRCTTDKQKPSLLDDAFKAVDQNGQIDTHYFKLALNVKNYRLMELLIQKGIFSKDSKYILEKLRNSAVQKKDARSLKMILSLEVENKTTPYQGDLMTPLMYAALLQDIECIQLLKEAGESISDHDKDKRTPLFYACQFGSNVSVIKALIENEAEIDLRSDENSEGAAHWACKSGNPEILRVLLRTKIDIFRLDKNGLTCVYHIKQDKPANVIRILDMLYAAGMKFDQLENNPIRIFTNSLYANSNASIIKWFLQHGTSLDTSLVDPARSNQQDTKLLTFINSKSRCCEEYMNIKKQFVDMIQTSATPRSNGSVNSTTKIPDLHPNQSAEDKPESNTMDAGSDDSIF